MLTNREIAAWLVEDNPRHLTELYFLADSIRETNVGNEVHLRSLLEISNHCQRQCIYCGLRAGNTGLKRYRMDREEILEAARGAAARGRKTIVLQSGEDNELTAEYVAELVREIKSKIDVAVTLSLGEYTRDEYFMMREAGADRYLLKHETIDPELYRRLHPKMSYENRIRCLVWLKEAGFQTGAGFMIGLPGQTPESIADDIMFLKKLDVEMAGVGPFLPHPETPLANEPHGTFEMALKAIAIIRIMLPRANIPATTALSTLNPRGTELALCSGANVVMPDTTPDRYRALYQIYPNRAGFTEATGGPNEKLAQLIHSIGRTVGTGYGHAMKKVGA